MVYNEIRGDLFEHTCNRHIVHCVSADFAMGAGIAKAISDYYGFTANDVNDDKKAGVQVMLHKIGASIYVHGKIINLVTKTRYWHKPGYANINRALLLLKEYVVDNNITSVVMPRIGCGLDRLDWEIVRHTILETFADTHIDILVCYL